MTKPRVYAVVTAKYGHSDVGGQLFDHKGEPLWSHLSSSEGWLWRDLTTGFTDRREALEAKYPEGYDVMCLAERSPDEDWKPLHDLWDQNHPGWRDRDDYNDDDGGN